MKKLSFKVNGWFGSRFNIVDEHENEIVKSITPYIQWPWSSKFMVSILGQKHLFKMHFPDQRRWSVYSEGGNKVAELRFFIITTKKVAKITLGEREYHIHFIYNQKGIYREIISINKKFTINTTTSIIWLNNLDGDISCDSDNLDVNDYIAIFSGIFSIIREN